MKLSFSLSSSKPSSKPPKSTLKSQQEPHDRSSSSPKKEFLTEFDPSKTLADKNPNVIPPIPNEDWRSRKKMKNIDLPVESDDPNLQFELDPNSTVESVDTSISYGLNIRAKKGSDSDSGKVDRPLSQASINNSMLKNLKDDLARMPDHKGMEEFEDFSVEEFGPLLLKGYGWQEGKGIGKNAKEDIKVVEYTKRAGRGGIGFVDDMPMSKTDDGRAGKTKKEDASNGGKREKFYRGKDVRIVGGSETGLKGRIVQVIGGGDRVVLRLSRTEEEVIVRVRDVADLGSVDEERCLKKLKELKLREEGKRENGGGRSKDYSGGRDRKENSGDKRKDVKRSRERLESGGSPLVSWLSSHIRVRIISKELKGGRLYLQKGEVVDVVGPTTCDISMDSSRELIQGVEQKFLETALPRRGGPVLVLYGRHKGVYGRLEEKDMDNETAVVRDADTHALFNVRLEQIAEYLGDPDDIGY